MSWNYRVIKHHGPKDTAWYGIHEVYYDQHGKIELWCEAPAETSDTLAGLAAALRLQLEAAERASERGILDAADLPREDDE